MAAGVAADRALRDLGQRSANWAEPRRGDRLCNACTPTGRSRNAVAVPAGLVLNTDQALRRTLRCSTRHGRDVASPYPRDLGTRERGDHADGLDRRTASPRRRAPRRRPRTRPRCRRDRRSSGRRHRGVLRVAGHGRRHGPEKLVEVDDGIGRHLDQLEEAATPSGGDLKPGRRPSPPARSGGPGGRADGRRRRRSASAPTSAVRRHAHPAEAGPTTTDPSPTWARRRRHELEEADPGDDR